MKWLMAAWMVFTAASAFAGNELGNGGDSFAQEFVAIGQKIAERLKNDPDPQVSSITFLEAVENAAVSTKAKLELRGVEVDAINYPESKRVEINRSRWKEYGIREKTSLVFHEYLGIAGIDDSNYEISGKYVEVPSLLFSRTNSEPITFSRAYSDLEDSGSGQFFVGLGSGYSMVGGNLGKLYSDEPTAEARIGYNMSRHLTARASVGVSNYAFTADPVGAVDSDMLILGVSAEAHPFGNPRVEGRKGFDPYVFAGVDYVLRSQSFNTFGWVEKDNAFGLSGGLGLGYFLSKKVVVGLEARIAQVFFRDRYEQTYLMSDVPDTTGFFYSGNASVRYFF